MIRIFSLRNVAVSILFLTLASPAYSQPRQQNGSDTSETARTVGEVCAGACHPADRYRTVRKSHDEWRKVVVQMVAHGAQLFSEDVDAVTDYLTAHFGRSSADGGKRP